MSKKKQKPVEWFYKKDADLTIGETKVSKTAKIILVIVLLLLLTTVVLGAYFRAEVYDFISNPVIILPEHEITLEVGSEFKPEDYVIKPDTEVTITYPDKKEVNTKKLGTYEVTYKSANSVRETELDLKVNVVDTTKPEIELKQDLLILTRGTDTDKFDAKEYIKSYKDNYDKKEDLKLTYTDSINFDKDMVDIVYSVVDKSGNEAIAKLKLVINSKPEQPEPPEPQKPVEPSKPAPPTPSKPEKPSPTPPKPNTPTPQPPSPPQPKPPAPPKPQPPKPTPPPQPPAPAQPYIKGVHDVTVKVGTDPSTLANKLISGVYGSGYVSCDFASVNLSSPGVYYATFSSNDGVTKKAKVTVVE